MYSVQKCVRYGINQFNTMLYCDSIYYAYHSDIPAIVSVGQKLIEGQPLGGAPRDRAEIYQDVTIGQHRFA